MQVSRAQVLGYRAQVQQLGGTGRGDLAVLDIGVQDTNGSAALAFSARGGTPPDSGELALVWAMRGAPHWVRRRDVAPLARETWPLTDDDALGRIVEAGTRLRRAGRGGLVGLQLITAEIRRQVARPSGKGAVSRALTEALPAEYSRYCRVCRATHVSEQVMRLAALPAGLEIEPGSSPPVLRRITGAGRWPTRWQPDPPAVAALVKQYLRLLGPATIADVAGFIGTKVRDLTPAWPDDLVEVSVDGRAGWLPAGSERQLAHGEPAVTRLLGAFDPYLQARDRELLVPDAAQRKQVWAILGSPGAALVGGEVAGTWRARLSGRRLTLTITPFADLSAAATSALTADAERIAAVRGADRLDVRVSPG